MLCGVDQLMFAICHLSLQAPISAELKILPYEEWSSSLFAHVSCVVYSANLKSARASAELRDQSRSFRECFSIKLLLRASAVPFFVLFCNIASANTARASAKHVGIAFANFEAQYEYTQMIYGEGISLSKQILRAYKQVKRGFGGASNF